MPDPFAVAGLQDALQDIDSARGLGNQNLSVLGVILSSVAHGTRLGNVLIEYVEKTFTLPDGHCLKFKTEISRSTVVPQAQKLGSTVFQSEPKHKVSEQYRALALEVEARFMSLQREEGPRIVANQ